MDATPQQNVRERRAISIPCSAARSSQSKSSAAAHRPRRSRRPARRWCGAGPWSSGGRSGSSAQARGGRWRHHRLHVSVPRAQKGSSRPRLDQQLLLGEHAADRGVGREGRRPGLRACSGVIASSVSWKATNSPRARGEAPVAGCRGAACSPGRSAVTRRMSGRPRRCRSLEPSSTTIVSTGA